MPAVRRRTKGSANTVQADAVTSSLGAVAGSSSGQPGSAVTKPRVLRGRRGSLQDLPNMPLDILFEVFAQMEPMDLLSLARTNRSFRELLMSKSSTSFWKAAMKNVPDLPDCPSFLSIPAKALRSDVEALTIKLKAVEDDNDKYQQVIDAQKEHTAAVQSFSTQCASWYEDKKESRSQELDTIRRNRLLAVVEKLKELGWNEELEFMADSDYFELSRLPALKQAKALTDRTWANFRQSVEEFMTAAKAARLLNLRKVVLRDRLKSLRIRVHKWRQAFDGLFPHARDFAALPEVQSILDIPTEEEVTNEDLDALEPMLADLVARWRTSADERLLAHLNASATAEHGEDVNPLTLAANLLFNCTRCTATRTYPEILTHCCNHYICYESDSPEVYNSSANAAMASRPWNPANFRLVSQNIRHMVVDLCEKDPARTTQADMDAFDARFVCDSCDGGGVVSVMTWRAAAMHGLERHISTYGASCKLAKAKDTYAAKARAVEVEAAEKVAETADTKRSSGWYCADCALIRFESKSNVTSHLRIEHGKEENPSEADYYRHPDSPPHCQDPVILASSKMDKAYLPMKVTMAMQTGLVAFLDDIPERRINRAPLGFDFMFDDDESDDGYGYGYGYDAGPYFGMSDDEDEDIFIANEGSHLAPLVKHISLGTQSQIPETYYAINPLNIPALVPFSNLRTFEDYGWNLFAENVDDLAHHAPALSTMALSCIDVHPFPPIEAFGNLQTLRLIILTYQRCKLLIKPSARCVTSTTVTTFSFHDDVTEWNEDYWKMIHFPNLRVLNLQNLQCSPSQCYQFIDLHPTLREVNVQFEHDHNLRLINLTRLIESTCFWVDFEENLKQRKERGIVTTRDVNAVKNPGDYMISETEIIWHEIDDEEYEPLNMGFDDFLDSHITTSSFAFKRVPADMSGDPEMWGGEDFMPRFTTTALALRMQNNWRWEEVGERPDYIQEFFAQDRFFGRVEELRLASDSWQTRITIADVFTEIGRQLKGWNYLRKVSLEWIIMDPAPWGTLDTYVKDVSVFTHRPLPSVRIPYVDDPCPPIEAWYGVPHSMDMLRSRAMNPNVEQYPIRLDLLEDFLETEYPGYDPSDPSLLMDIWERRHCPKVASYVSYLAQCCPTLEQVDWYPKGGDGLYYSTVRWSWKIVRKTYNGRHCPDKIRVSGQLAWAGCPRGEPHPLKMLVGQELEHYLSRSRAEACHATC
ncbi:hypothetical protein EIP91_001309 [Steccherinum ochraceum]|uniref:F-box domain-containing protein n=1 Tax=Steccherinum ochraceum TaxID=92696 RepID=A0A4R0RUX4_9APHY|nr:hypothetical protein EIP91_001309 [Steccherinum ochraceum]